MDLSKSLIQQTWHQAPLSQLRFQGWIGWIAMVLLPFALLLPKVNSFPYPSQETPYSDLVVSHYPDMLYFRQALFEGKSIPTWSPTILSGYPFASNPLAGLWYVPGWLALVLPLPFGFNLLVMLHFLWGGLGLVLLLREEGLSSRSSLFAGFVFCALPKLYAHYGAGHLTLLYAVPWTPWLLYALRRSIHLLSSPRNQISKRADLSIQVFWLMLPAIVMSLIFLADPRWAGFAGLVGLAYWMKDIRNRLFKKSTFLWVGWQVFLIGLLCAPLALPLIEYIRLSTRAIMNANDLEIFSLSPVNLLGLIYPPFGGFHEWVIYPGVVVFVLGVLGILWRSTRRRAAFWVFLTIISLAFSLGSLLPGFEWLSLIPGFNLLRVPSRALFLTGLGFACLSAYSLQSLLDSHWRVNTRHTRVFLIGLVGFTSLLTIGAWILTDKLQPSMLVGSIAMATTVVWIGLKFSGHLGDKWFLSGLIGICLLDYWMVNSSLFTTKPASEVNSEQEKLAQQLAGENSLFRTYSPSYSMPQQTAARYGLQLADGVDPLQLASYVHYMEKASGVPSTGYSVTTPPFASGEPSTDNAAYIPNPKLLGLLNVRYILSEFDLVADGLIPSGRYGETRIFRNIYELPRAWIQPSEANLGQRIKSVVVTVWSPTRIEISLPANPAIRDKADWLVLSEIYYPGWRAWVDGKPVKIQPTGGLLRSLELSPGVQRVTFLYHPVSVYVGASLCLAGIVLLIMMLFNNRFREILTPGDQEAHYGLSR